LSKPDIDKDLIQQTIDLEEALGVSLRGKKALRERFGQALIDKMIARVEKGVGFRSAKLHSPYSDEYLKSDEAKAAGKKSSPINMTLNGDMLGTLDIKKQTSDSITLGWKGGAGNIQNKKAYAHQVGRTGDSSVTVPKRPFFGLTNKEIAEVRKEFASELREIMRKQKKKGGG